MSPTDTDNIGYSPDYPVSVTKPAFTSTGLTVDRRDGQVFVTAHRGSTSISVPLSREESRILAIALAAAAGTGAPSAEA